MGCWVEQGAELLKPVSIAGGAFMEPCQKANWRRGLCGRLGTFTQWKKGCARKKLGHSYAPQCVPGKAAQCCSRYAGEWSWSGDGHCRKHEIASETTERNQNGDSQI